MGLLICAFITLFINCSIAVCIAMLSGEDGHEYDIADIAIICSLDIPEWLIYFSGAYDVVMSCLCLYAFIIPLKKLLQSLPSERRISHPSSARLSSVGLKFVIVTITNLRPTE